MLRTAIRTRSMWISFPFHVACKFIFGEYGESCAFNHVLLLVYLSLNLALPCCICRSLTLWMDIQPNTVEIQFLMNSSLRHHCSKYCFRVMHFTQAQVSNSILSENQIFQLVSPWKLINKLESLGRSQFIKYSELNHFVYVSHSQMPMLPCTNHLTIERHTRHTCSLTYQADLMSLHSEITVWVSEPILWEISALLYLVNFFIGITPFSIHLIHLDSISLHWRWSFQKTLSKGWIGEFSWHLLPTHQILTSHPSLLLLQMSS